MLTSASPSPLVLWHGRHTRHLSRHLSQTVYNRILGRASVCDGSLQKQITIRCCRFSDGKFSGPFRHYVDRVLLVRRRIGRTYFKQCIVVYILVHLPILTLSDWSVQRDATNLTICFGKPISTSLLPRDCDQLDQML